MAERSDRAAVVVSDIETGPEAMTPEEQEAGWQGLPSVVGGVAAWTVSMVAVVRGDYDAEQRLKALGYGTRRAYLEAQPVIQAKTRTTGSARMLFSAWLIRVSQANKSSPSARSSSKPTPRLAR